MAIKLYYYYYIYIYIIYPGIYTCIYIIWYVRNVNTYQIFDNNWHNKGAIQARYPLSSIINEGVLSGNGLSRRNYVWRGFCPRGFCPEMAYV